MPDTLKVTGPKGGVVAPHAQPGKLAKLLPGFVKRYGKVTVQAAEPTSTAVPPKLTARQLVVQFANWACAHNGDIHYAETRPIPHVDTRTLPRLPFTTDCSGFATMAYAYAGAADPNGLAYDGQGYTGTLLANARKRKKIVPVAKVRPGDVAVFGCKSYPSGHHAAVVVAVHARSYAGVEVASHGQESGPFPIAVSVEASYQPDGLAGVVFISVLP